MNIENVQFHRGCVMKLELHSMNALQGGIASVFINIMLIYINVCSFLKNLGK
jgi:hypothetical protein